jgi:pilus assembly protein Flp/PilA
LLKTRLSGQQPNRCQLAHPNEGSTMRFLRNLLRKEDGQDMVEYALLAAFISIVAIVTIRNIGPLVDAVYQNVQSALT